MGPRRLWIALLLAALQYAGVHASGCAGAQEPKGACPDIQPAGVDCKPRPVNPGDKPDKQCPASDLYLSKGGNTKWEKLKKIKCDNGATPSWEAEIHPSGNHKLTSTDTVVCAKKQPKLSCKAQPDLTAADGTQFPEWGGETITTFTVDAPLSCTTTTKKVFINKGSKWEGVTITCDRDTGMWMEGLTVVQSGAQVVCADKEPNPIPCANPLKPAQCYKFTANIGCEAPNPLSTSDVICANGVLYYKEGAAWTQSGPLKCDITSGKWKDGAADKNLVAGNEVICATSDPTAGECADLHVDPCAGNGIAGCQKPTSLSSPSGTLLGCSSGSGNLYFQAPGNKWMEAQSIKCEDDQGSAVWKIDYQFGTDPKHKTFAPTHYAICASTNPDPNACPTLPIPSHTQDTLAVYDASNPETTEAGKVAKCTPIVVGSTLILPDFITDKGNILGAHMAPVCGVNGEWEYKDPTVEGKLIGCILRKCKQCLLPAGTIPAAADIRTVPGPSPYEHVTNGICATLENSLKALFLLDLQGDGGKLRVYKGLIECTDQKLFMVDGKTVNAFAAVQQAYCAGRDEPSAKFLRMKTNCPGDVPNCEGAEYSRVGDYDHLKCNKANQKMMVKEDSSQFYYDLKVNDIKCKKDELKWSVEFARYDEKRDLDLKYSVFCGDENPNPEPTTTTTERVPEDEICEVCKTKKPANFEEDCDKCDDNALQFEHSSETKCTITAESGRKLLTNNNEEVEAIFCTRTDEYDPDVKWTKTDGTTAITKVSARAELKTDSWKPLSYVVVALVFVAIGGMAIGCVVIYMRMRKKLSVREGKKERGVTKKFTSSNVVKTNNGKSSAAGSKEIKSKEPVKSKMEENNEDAPTLKL